jgi:hypothetical protein
MTSPPISKLQDRVLRAADTLLRKNGTVGLLELLTEMNFVHWSHVEQWRRANPAYRYICEHIQCGADKLKQTQQHFHDWARALGLATVQAEYARRSVTGTVPLQFTGNADASQEALFRTHYARADLSDKQQAKLEQKLAKVEDLVVFIAVSDSTICSECAQDMPRGTFFTLEQQQPLCLECADMDHLVMLQAGDVAMTRRAKKYSPLSAVVTKFNRSRKRYERQGLLVSEAALARAEDECISDADIRAARRKSAAAMRTVVDAKFIQQMTKAIQALFPKCPSVEAKEIATHAAERGSGRVGRTAAAQELDERPLTLAVIAHIRHIHTSYDTLLMQGTDRQQAREMIREKVEQVLGKWR